MIDIDSIDFTSEEMVAELDDYKCSAEDVKHSFNELMLDKAIWEDDHWRTIGILKDVLSDYKILEIDGSSGDGKLIVLDDENIAKIKELI